MNNAGARFLLDTLVPALRSGKYDQCYGCLRDGDKFCCLGVAANEWNSTRWTKAGNRYSWHGKDVYGATVADVFSLPYEIRQATGLGINGDDEFITQAAIDMLVARTNPSQRELRQIGRPGLTHCNDTFEFDFLTIADICETAANNYLAAQQEGLT